MSDESPDEEEECRSHLDDVPDGCGCAEVWEHASAHRERASVNSDDD